MNRIDRLFGILTTLQSKKYTSADFIAEKFSIGIRTVYRDIKALIEQGVPVSFEPQKGYYVMKGYFLPPVSFTTEEAQALLMIESMVMGFTDKSIKNHYSNALNKVKSVLHRTQKEAIELLQQNIKMQLPSFFQGNDYEYLTVIQEAITNKTCLYLEYKNAQDEVSERLVEPIGLVFYAFSWHLIAWCCKRQDYRDFRVSRVILLRGSIQPFSKEIHMALNEYMKQIPVDY
jgi:predicted DNA-binding transcriptional regulator YafY